MPLVYSTKSVLGKVIDTNKNISFDIVSSNALLTIISRKLVENGEEHQLEFFASEKEHLENMLKDRECFDIFSHAWVFFGYNYEPHRKKDLKLILNLFMKYNMSYTFLGGRNKNE